jgi:hypothetical protein
MELCTAANVWEDIALAKFDQDELGVVGVGRVVLQAVRRGSEETQGLVKVGSTSARATAEVDAAS